VPSKLEQYHAALEWANSVRRILSLPAVNALEPGRMGSPQSCPVARTITFGVEDDYTASVSGATRVYRGADALRALNVGTPNEVAGFITAFDGGRFPELQD
jgi:hypothetical protein